MTLLVVVSLLSSSIIIIISTIIIIKSLSQFFPESPKVADAGDKTRACRPKKRPIDDKKDDDEDDERKSDEDQLKSPTKRGRRKGPSIATMKENDSVAAKAVKMKTIIVEPTTRTMRTRSCRNGGATSDARDRDKKRATKSSSVVCDNDRNTRGRDWFKKGANRMSSVVCDNEDCSDSPNNEISVGKDICDKSATLNAGKCTRSHSKSATNNIIVEKGTSLDSSVSEGKARNCDRIPTKTFQDSPVSRGKERNRERNPTKTVSKLCVTCKVCDKVCLKKTVWRHLQVHAALGELPPPGEGTSLLADLNPLDVMCNLCYKVFQKTSMPKHARMHRLQGDVSKERSQRRNNAQIRDGPDQGMTEPGKNNQENDMAEKIQKTQIETECLTSTDPGLKTEGLEKSIGANVVLDSNAASSNGVDDTAKESSTYLVSHTLETMTQPHVQEPKEKTKSSTINLGLRDNRDLTMEGKLDINGKMTKTKSKKHESSLTCKICGEICEEDEIWRHLGVHKVRKELPTEKDAILVDGIHPGRAMCDICFEILSRSQLQRHRQQHIKQNEEISQAGGTGNEIEGYDDLQEFAKKDKDGKEKCVSLPYCEICTRQIKGSWNRHQVLHHEAELSVLGLPPEAYIMKCHMCDMKFPDIILLRHHQTQRGHQVQPTRLLRSLPKKSKSKSTNHDASDLNESSTGSSVDLGDTKPPSQEVTYGRENTAEGVEITTKQEGEISDNGMVRKIPLPQDLAEKVSALLEEEPNPTYAEYSKLYAAARKGNGKEPPRENKMQQRCMVCGKVFKSAHNARKHVSDHHFKIKRFECLVCGLEMSTRGKVNIHLLRHTGEKPYACTSCDAEFQYKYLLNRHLEDVHNGPPVRNLERLRRAKKQVESVCEICGAVLSSAYSLQSHIKNKHKEAKYVDCDICGLKLKEASLKDHKIQIHERRIAHICDLCGKGFRYRESYTYHMNTHKGLKPFKCEECGQKLVSRENYKNHMNRHRGIKPHKCDLCQMAFYSYAELCNHKKGHTNQRAYKCTQCPKAFNRLSGLTAHKAVHAREFKYQCKICGKKFNQSSSCRTHEKRHSGVKPFACCYCNKAFTTKGDCKRHENTIHKGFTDPYMKIQGRQKSTNQMITLPVCAEVDGEVVTDIEETVQVIVDNEQAIGEVLYLMSMQGGAANLVTEEK